MYQFANKIMSFGLSENARWMRRKGLKTGRLPASLLLSLVHFAPTASVPAYEV